MSPYIDFHTHRKSKNADVISVYNLMLNEESNVPIGKFSAGLHPWFADNYSPQEIDDVLEQFVSEQNLVALGETGLDKSCHIPMKVQQDIFEIHLKKANEKNKPVVLHCVKAWEELIELTSGFPKAKILHGYNGTPELTKRLLDQNFLFSIGTAILNPEAKIQNSIKIIPITSMFCETDNYELPIRNIYTTLSCKLNVQEEDLVEIVFSAFNRLSSD